jgi:hypothetical protein
MGEGGAHVIFLLDFLALMAQAELAQRGPACFRFWYLGGVRFRKNQWISV